MDSKNLNDDIRQWAEQKKKESGIIDSIKPESPKEYISKPPTIVIGKWAANLRKMQNLRNQKN